ncbi:hypothetical protein [Saccharopolyspora mangrovi]|uniref:Uncharacterized protein n=1 Tax=Saccharopolyspora mangrovi TaxID=3082379 RepID=A0ABU6A7E8_9PSEU|nr:hypothetical protein [Saccharopolyspora sp. S2-29]MEB3367415.1 hypothetical protein [Saccharopolyspora sp. S2-29]
MAVLDVLTLSEAKTSLNIRDAVTQNDVELAGFITAASKRLDWLIGPVVRRQLISELHSGGGEHVFLKFYPVFSVQTVTEFKRDEAAGLVLAAETNLSRPDEAYQTHQYATGGGLLADRISRRSSAGTFSNRRARWAPGEENVEVSYTAGRFDVTANVEPLYKQGAALILQNMWRGQQDSTGGLGEFDVPQNNFPRWAVPRAVVQLFQDEIQQPKRLVA